MALLILLFIIVSVFLRSRVHKNKRNSRNVRYKAAQKCVFVSVYVPKLNVCNHIKNTSTWVEFFCGNFPQKFKDKQFFTTFPALLRVNISAEFYPEFTAKKCT
jgi:hypothetical protein